MLSSINPEVLYPIIPIVALMIPIVAIVGAFYSRWRRDRLIHDTIRMLAEKGQPIPPELLESCRPRIAILSDGDKQWGSPLGHGLKLIAIGIGLGIMFYAMNSDNWMWAVGAIPMCLGLAYLLQWKLEQKPRA